MGKCTFRGTKFKHNVLSKNLAQKSNNRCRIESFMLLLGCVTCTLTHIIGTRNNLQETPKIPKGEIFSRFVNPKLWRKKASPCFLSQPVVHRQSRYEVHTYLHSDFCLLFLCWTFRLHSINGGGKGIFKKLSLHKKMS